MRRGAQSWSPKPNCLKVIHNSLLLRVIITVLNGFSKVMHVTAKRIETIWFILRELLSLLAMSCSTYIVCKYHCWTSNWISDDNGPLMANWCSFRIKYIRSLDYQAIQLNALFSSIENLSRFCWRALRFTKEWRTWARFAWCSVYVKNKKG